MTLHKSSEKGGERWTQEFRERRRKMDARVQRKEEKRWTQEFRERRKKMDTRVQRNEEKDGQN